MLDYLMFKVAANNTEFLQTSYIILIAFLLSTLIGTTYVKTFRGLSYSHNYVHAVILASIVAATVMLAIGDSLARGLGMIGALAIIRFRTNFKDAKDILFMFASLAAGIACGVGAYKVAIAGTVGFIMTSFLLYVSPLGQSRTFDGMLRFNCENGDGTQHALQNVFKEHCITFTLVTLRDMQQGERMDYAYQIKLRKDGGGANLVASLSHHVPSARGISLMLQDTTVEL